MFKLSSYNSRGLPKDRNGLLRRPDIGALLDQSDILCVQETWYNKQELPNLNSLHDDFHGTGVATVDPADGLLIGHPPGGVAIMWNKCLDKCVKPIDFNCNWCVGLEVLLDQKKFVIVNLYMPFQCSDNEDKYLDCLGYLKSMMEELELTCYVLIGDWNANLRDVSNIGNVNFARHMLNFCEDCSCIASTQLLLPPDSYTYVSQSWESMSWLDHAVSTEDFHQIISDIKIHYDVSDEDHISFTLKLEVNDVPSVTDIRNDCVPRLCWENVTSQDRYNYCNATSNLLGQVELPEGVLCNDINCNNSSHLDASIDLYNCIMDCLKQSDDTCFE